jgi:hydroxymethylpyrimidine/phosphomethylpyrimidine kinase
VLLRCGRLKRHHYESDEDAPEALALDLFYDGEEFALFEAPFIATVGARHGASSILSLSILDRLTRGDDYPRAIQWAKAEVTEALRHAEDQAIEASPSYFWQREHKSDPRRSSAST